jgi:hypothetical protein
MNTSRIWIMGSLAVVVIAVIFGVLWLRRSPVPSANRSASTDSVNTAEPRGEGGGLAMRVVSVTDASPPSTSTSAVISEGPDPSTILIYPGGSRGGMGEAPLTTLAALQGKRDTSVSQRTLLEDQVALPTGERAGTAGNESVPQGVAGGQDPDGDGLTTDQELQAGTDPRVADTDGDGITDGDEVRVTRTDPLQSDSDQDGLTDGEERGRYHTDPLNPDSDSDGYKDGEEVRNGYNPRGSGKLST